MEVFDIRLVLGRYCQVYVKVLREAYLTFRRHVLQIGNVEVFLESMTIESDCNKLLRKPPPAGQDRKTTGRRLI